MYPVTDKVHARSFPKPNLVVLLVLKSYPRLFHNIRTKLLLFSLANAPCLSLRSEDVSDSLLAENELFN